MLIRLLLVAVQLCDITAPSAGLLFERRWASAGLFAPLSLRRGTATRLHSRSNESDDDSSEDKAGNECSVWAEVGALAAANLPMEPASELSEVDILSAIFRGLMYNDVPQPDTGLQRCFAFMTLPCKKLVTGHGNVPEERTLEKFLEYAKSSPKIAPFIGAKDIEFGELSVIAGTATRGAIASMPLRVTTPIRSPLVHDSGLVRNALVASEKVTRT